MNREENEMEGVDWKGYEIRDRELKNYIELLDK